MEQKYLTKKDLEKLYDREEGYYNSYCWFEDLICDVCGKLIQNSDDIFASEQECIRDGYEIITFCSDCSKLPNRIKLVKIWGKVKV